jgi:hypothetical protein
MLIISPVCSCISLHHHCPCKTEIKNCHHYGQQAYDFFRFHKIFLWDKTLLNRCKNIVFAAWLDADLTKLILLMAVE